MARTKKRPAIQAFKNDPKLKAMYLRRVRKHQKADEIVQGIGCEKNGHFRGCCIGCLAEFYPAHAFLAKEWDAPEEIFRLADAIHEGLPLKLAKEWPAQFTKAVPVGADLSMVWPKLALWILADEKDGVKRFAGDRADVRKTIEGVAALYREWIESGTKPEQSRWLSAWSAARSAAWSAARSAARSAESAAWSAESAAWSESAASAWSAASAASAAESAESAASAASAESAASAYWKKLADKLEKLLAAAK